MEREINKRICKSDLVSVYRPCFPRVQTITFSSGTQRTVTNHYLRGNFNKFRRTSIRQNALTPIQFNKKINNEKMV